MAEPAQAPIENKRDRSTIEFPYMDLDNAIEIAKAVHQSGGSCTKEQLAARMDASATSGAFYQRITTAKMFGLIDYERGTMTLTDLGLEICDAQRERAARVQAFFNVELYKALYDRFKTGPLPPSSGLEDAIGKLGVAPKQKDKARQAFQRSAKQAGFFEFGPEKLVLPSTGVRPPEPQARKKDEEKPGINRATFVTHQANEIPLNPFIEGLLKALPPIDAQWPAVARKKWLQTAESIFGLLYKD